MGLAEAFRRLTGRTPAAREDLRRVRPVRAQTAAWRDAEEGGIIVEAPAVRHGWGSRLLYPLAEPGRRTRSFELEPVGAFVWGLCDGAHSVAEISKRLQSRFKMSRLEADAALAAFLQMLARRGLIRLERPKR